MLAIKAAATFSLAISGRQSGQMMSTLQVDAPRFRSPIVGHHFKPGGLSAPFNGHRSPLFELKALLHDDSLEESASEDKPNKKRQETKPVKIELANPLAQESLEHLIEGNARFREGKLENFVGIMQRVYRTAEGQCPHSTIVGCMDSRTSADLVFDQTIGDVFSLRVAGNLVNPHILGSLEFACEHVGTPLVVVMGHTNCGAINGAMAGGTKGDKSHLSELLKEIRTVMESSKLDPKEVDADEVAKCNVFHSMRKIRELSPVIRQLLDNEEIDMVGAMYDVRTGKVDFFQDLN